MEKIQKGFKFKNKLLFDQRCHFVQYLVNERPKQIVFKYWIKRELRWGYVVETEKSFDKNIRFGNYVSCKKRTVKELI